MCEARGRQRFERPIGTGTRGCLHLRNQYFEGIFTLNTFAGDNIRAIAELRIFDDLRNGGLAKYVIQNRIVIQMDDENA